jgi:hypothetical protein
MPRLDYALLCDHVRVDQGLAHVIAAGIDTVYAATVPADRNLGILIRLQFTRNECGRTHRVEGVFQDTDGQRLARLSGSLVPPWRDDLPLGWTTGAQIGLNVAVSLPRYGLYTFEILVNDSSVKSLDFRVLPIPGEPDADPGGPRP